jgi:hypothetical protein
MIDIIALASICEAAIEGGNKLYEEYKKRKLSDAEKELLVAAAEKGEFFIFSADGVPDWIAAGRETFPEDPAGDPAIAAKYDDAFTNLCKRGYIKYDDGKLFRLTYQGFEKARKLAGK